MPVNIPGHRQKQLQCRAATSTDNKKGTYDRQSYEFLVIFVKTVLINCRYGTFNTPAVANFATKHKQQFTYEKE